MRSLLRFKTFVFVPKFRVRIPSTENWFGGLQYLFIDSDSVFKLSNFHPLLPSIAATRIVRKNGPWKAASNIRDPI